MALPALPVQGQNPWYDERTSWDNAVTAELSTLTAGLAGKASTSYVDSQITLTSEEFDTQVGNLQSQITNLQMGNPGQKYKIVACALRNTGSGWGLIQDASHQPIGVTGVSINGGFLQLNYNFTSSRVGTLVVASDETFVTMGIQGGASVGLSAANIQLVKQGGNYDYVSWNGASWVSSTGFVTSTSLNATTGLIRFTHEEVTETLSGIVSMRSDGANRALQGGMGATSLDVTVFPYNSATSLKAASTDMRFFIFRSGARKMAPADVSSASGNLWVYGILEVA